MLSRLPIIGVRSHVDDRKPGARATAKDPWLFSRDCLEVQIALDSDRRLTLLVNHLKSKFIDHRTANTPAKAARAQQDNDKRRRQQAEAVLRIARERFPVRTSSASSSPSSVTSTTPRRPRRSHRSMTEAA